MLDSFNTVFRNVIEAFLRIATEVHPFFGLAVVSVLTGIGMLWVFGLTSNQKAISETKKRLQAYLLELRLYGDDLSLVWQAQKNLVTGNVRYIGLMLRPMLVLTVPLVVLLIHLDAFYGRTPLVVGEAGIVTMQVSGRLGSNAPAPELHALDGITVETPAVRAIEAGQMSWRIRASKPVSGDLRFVWRDKEWVKSVEGGVGARYLSSRRVTGVWDAFLYPGENRLAADEVEWIEVSYPAGSIEFAGLDLHWLVWFMVLSMVSAVLFKGRFRVVF